MERPEEMAESRNQRAVFTGSSNREWGKKATRVSSVAIIRLGDDRYEILESSHIRQNNESAENIDESTRRSRSLGVFVLKNGVPRWEENGAVPPADTVKEYFIDRTPGYNSIETSMARNEDIDNLLTDYRNTQPTEAGDEEKKLLKAAFGPGAEVIDIISGRRTKL